MTNKKEKMSCWEWFCEVFLFAMVVIGLCNFIPWALGGLVDDGPSQSEEVSQRIWSLKNEIADCVDNIGVTYQTQGHTHWAIYSHATSTLEEVKSCLANL